MSEPRAARFARRRRRRDIIVTVVCAVLLAAAGVYLITRPGRAPAQGIPAPQTSGGNIAAPSVVATGSGEPTGHVSGLPMPRGDLPGWKQTFADDFTGPVKTNWGIYDGQPDGDPGGWFAPRQVNSQGGELVIRGSRGDTPNGNIYVTGGMSSKLSQIYGRYEVRFRMDRGRGIQFNLMLWPTDDSWPPEINFAEDNGKERTGFAANMHYGPPHKVVSRHHNIDTTQWHTAGVEWTPGKLTYLIDGQVWATVESSHVPKVPMSIAIQTQAWHCGTSWAGCPNSSTPREVNLHVDWVVAYTPA
ncbi:glycoside hydrolase family 16 protein [Allorhizocola rhizosphaerae]|uniref:glycoside hydrolase family 16 protein n=1 Tax=Allorhizocola rhizosphaerae TaxID=1872709 RepID=UPI000E3BAD39|nr:glycoside hydrolase family 16 protein [Allorhizocola rhizosphaerae]